jgi:hypothetical protein
LISFNILYQTKKQAYQTLFIIIIFHDLKSIGVSFSEFFSNF